MEEIIICNTSEAPRKGKARDITFYLDQIRQKYELEFDKLEAICADGYIKPPYPYQWRATTKIRVGEDDPFEGLGGSPFEAIKELWNHIKYVSSLPENEDDWN
jgi:hypothetical protein